MIRLPKKIEKVIKNELSEDYSVLRRIYIERMVKEMCVNLIVLCVGTKQRLIILRYFGDNSYCFLGGYADMAEIVEELSYQVQKLS